MNTDEAQLEHKQEETEWKEYEQAMEMCTTWLSQIVLCPKCGYAMRNSQFTCPCCGEEVE